MLDLYVIADYIQDHDLRELVRRRLDEAHPRFWSDPASTTGKYHPEFDNGCMGLVRHTALVAVAAVDGLRRYYGNDVPRHMVDSALAAGLLHDICQHGYPEWGEYIDPEHPRLAHNLLTDIGDGVLYTTQVADIATAILNHSGIWDARDPLEPDATSDYYARRDLVVLVLVLQEADYYSSRIYVGTPSRSRMTETLNQYKVLSD